MPDLVPPLVAVDIPGLRRVGYRAYPLVDHVADKVSACLETRLRSGEVTASTRYKDLVDLVLIVRTQRLPASELRRAVLLQLVHRGLPLPGQFLVPGPLWPAGYEAKAVEVADLGVLGRFPAAYSLIKKVLDPILAGTAVGYWDPALEAWSG